MSCIPLSNCRLFPLRGVPRGDQGAGSQGPLRACVFGKPSGVLSEHCLGLGGGGPPRNVRISVVSGAVR